MLEQKKSKMQKKNLDSSPDETRTFEKGKVNIANFEDITIGRATLEPGWSWDKCVKPLAKTNSCESPHSQYIVSGRMKVVMDDGSEEEFGPGDALVIPSGHNAWVIGNEPVIAVDFTGLKDYAKS
ncbi:MAG: cupin domain-containing protein [Candidatus Nitrosocosmicus sp.]